jgi:hypothetical protein
VSDDTPGRSYAGVPLEQHVDRILGRRAADVLDVWSAGDAEALDALAREVVHALKVEHTDHDADYHGFYSDLFPTVRETIEAIRTYARTRYRERIVDPQTNR